MGKSKMKTVCFVILNYMSYNETIECVKSIKKLRQVEFNIQIIIVDNGSDNNSKFVLEKEYGRDIQIDLIFLDKNLGFSEGNNIGYRYAIEHYNIAYIIVANSDIIFVDRKMIKKIDNTWKKYGFDVLGPNIWVPKYRKTQNPLRERPLTISNVREMIQEKEIELISYEKQIVNREKHSVAINKKAIQQISKNVKVLKKLYIIVQNLLGQIKYIHIKINNKQIKERQVLHGCCLILSRQFIEKNKTLFEPVTFLYFEEDLLYLKCTKMKMKILFNSDILVHHKEGMSTAVKTSDGIEKMLLKNKQILKSLKILLNEMENAI